MWGKIVGTIVGLWLMAAPGIFSFTAGAADNGHILGPVIATFAIVSFWECTDAVQRWILPLAIWLLVAPWILNYATTAAIVSDMACGVICIAASRSKRVLKHKFGGGWMSLWQKNPPHLQE